MVVAHQKREHEEAAECVFYVTSYVTILSFIKCGRHQRNKSMRWRPERSAGKQIMRSTLAQLRAAITAYLHIATVRVTGQTRSGLQWRFRDKLYILLFFPWQFSFVSDVIQPPPQQFLDNRQK